MRDASGVDAGMHMHWSGSAVRDRSSDFAANAGLPFDRLEHSIAENSPDMVILLDRDGFIRFINRTAPDLSVDEVMGRQILQFVPPAQRETARGTYERVALTAQPAQFYSEYYGDDGTCSRWFARVYPLMRDGHVAGFIVLSREVDHTDEDAAAGDDPLFDLCEDVLCVLDADGRFERVNTALERTLGHRRCELVGRRLFDFVHPDDSVRVPASGTGGLALPAHSLELRLRHRDGDYRLLTWRVTHAGGRFFALARSAAGHDRFEAQQLDPHGLQSVGRIATGVAHDFGNLLQAVRLAAGAARQRAGSDAELRTALDDIECATERAGDLIQRLLASARKEPAAFEPVDLNRLCEELLPLVRRLAPSAVEINLALAGGPCIVAAERALLEQVLINLCVNARDAMPEGGLLRISTAASIASDEAFCREHPRAVPGARYALLRVEDNGTGMSEEVQARVFEPFFSTKPRGQGHGVGLATARDTVDRCGGFVRVRSRAGHGTVFDVYVPHASGVSSKTQRPEPATLPAPASEPSATILLAEDEELLRLPLRELLEQAGYRVLCARDGQEAVEIYRRCGGAVDLLLLDVAMPRMSGPQVLAELRKANCAVPALFTSGYDPGSPQGEGCEGGAMLHKPYDSAVLLRRIAETLATAPAGGG